MEIVEVKVEALVPYRNNPRKNEKAVPSVMDSIMEYGFKVPIVATRDNVIVTGHTRLEAAKRLHMETVPVIYADDLDEEQIRAYRLADNKTGELATWDADKLEEELDALGTDLGLFEEKFEKLEADLCEIDLDEYKDEAFKYECKACGFRFNA